MALLLDGLVSVFYDEFLRFTHRFWIVYRARIIVVYGVKDKTSGYQKASKFPRFLVRLFWRLEFVIDERHARIAFRAWASAER